MANFRLLIGKNDKEMTNMTKGLLKKQVNYCS